MAKEKGIKFEGLTIKGIRPMTKVEMLQIFGEDLTGTHDGTPTMIVFETGEKLFALQDPEGNGPGMMVIENKKADKQWYVFADK